MAKKKKKGGVNNKKPAKKDALDYMVLPKIEVSSEVKRGIALVIILALGALSLVSLFGLGGKVGNYLDQSLILAFGYGKWIFPLILLAWGFFLYQKNKGYFRGSHYLGLFLFILSFQSLLHIFFNRARWEEIVHAGKGGGYIGLFLVKGFYSILSFWGSLIVLIALFLISLMLIFNTHLGNILGKSSLVFKILKPFKYLFAWIPWLFSSKEEDEFAEEDEEPEAQELPLEETPEEAPAFASKAISEGSGEEKKEVPVRKEEKEKEETPSWETSNIKIDLPLSLLNKKTGKPNSGDIKHNSYIIRRTLENFNIPVEMGEIEVGPSVTQYTLKPAEGVKLAKLTNLSNDLALSLAAHPIRIEAPIPGKSLVGIEVPNKTKAMVNLREVLDSKDFKKRENNLMMALGEDVAGHSWSYDIGRMPHLLIAGATNSGKSVCINSLIVSLLYQNDPDTLRFIMVDPKRVELPIYNGIPHLLTPVITDISKTINALKWCLNEMDRRFEILSQAKKRNIESYNQSASEKMPYIVFIVDELADLMVAAGRDVEAGVIRLTQMARAVGIHLVLATQRPSVDVITGLIKANIPTRVAFSVASGVDSKTILDSLGAEKLLGQGDMLFVSPEISKPKRIQGVFISDAEVKRVVNYIKERSGEFDYLDEVTEKQKVEGTSVSGFSGDDNDSDVFYEEAKETVINSGKASASFLQRKLRVGYARAASLLDELEEAGVVGPANGSNPREVLVSQEDYESLQNQGVSGVDLHNREDAEAPESYFDEEEAEDEDDSPAEEEFNQEESKEEDGENNQDLDEENEEDEDESDADIPKEENDPSSPSANSTSSSQAEEDKDEGSEDEDDDDDGLYFAK